MSDVETIDDLMPTATPSPEQIREWRSLSRDEQVRRLAASLSHPDCRAETTDTMSDILAAAHARSDSKRRG
jgi:hypothetical protein